MLNLAKLFSELANEYNAELHLEKKFGFSGYFEFKDQRRFFFRNACIDINGQAAAAVAKDKNFCSQFLNSAGIPGPQEILIYSQSYYDDTLSKFPNFSKNMNTHEDALIFADNVGYPVFCKPNDGQSGIDVFCVTNRNELLHRIEQLTAKHDLVLIQKAIQGKDYRVVVLNGLVVAAYLREPLSVTGDGESRIQKLISKKISKLASIGRALKLMSDATPIYSYLKQNDIDLNYVPSIGEQVQLLPNANLSMGGNAEDVTGALPDDIKELCIRAAQTLGLNFCGVDIISENIQISNSKTVVLELNSSPGLRNFATIGSDQKDVVVNIYKKIVQTLSARQ